MKKFFTLCAAFAALLSAEAAPQFVKRANVAELKSVMDSQLSDYAVNKKTLAMADRAAVMKEHGMEMSFDRPKRAQGEVYECTYNAWTADNHVTGTRFNINTSDYAYTFRFDVMCSPAELEMGKVYTLEDCDPSFTFMMDNTTYAMIGFWDLALEFYMTEQQEMMLEATCVVTGGSTYHLAYKPLERPETFTDVELTNLDFRFLDRTEPYGVFQFTATNDDNYELAICIASDGQIEGSYTTEDLFEGINNYTYLKKGTMPIELCDVEMQVASLGENNYHIDGKMYAYNGNCYLINDDYCEPTAKNKAEITATNLRVDDSMFDRVKQLYGYGRFEISASTDEYKISGSLLSYEDAVGHYSDDQHRVSYLEITDAQGKTTSVFSSDFDVVNTDGEWTIKGTMLGWNSTEYTVDLCFKSPEITGEGNYTSTNGTLIDLCGSLGHFLVSSLDEEANEFKVILPAVGVADGKYTELSAGIYDNCYIITGGKTYEMYNCDFDLTVDKKAAVFMMTGTCQGGELLFTVNISGTYYPVEPYIDPFDAIEEDGEVDVQYSLEDIEFELSEEDGCAYLYVRSEERNDAWSAILFVEGNELPAGEYRLTDTFEPGTAQRGRVHQGNIYPTLYMQLNEEGYVTVPLWYCTTGSIYVAYDEEGNIMVECKAYNSNGVPVHVTVNMPEGVGIEQVATEAQKDGKFYEQNAVVIRRNGVKYNGFGQRVKY